MKDALANDYRLSIVLRMLSTGTPRARGTREELVRCHPKYEMGSRLRSRSEWPRLSVSLQMLIPLH